MSGVAPQDGSAAAAAFPAAEAAEWAASCLVHSWFSSAHVAG